MLVGPLLVTVTACETGLPTGVAETAAGPRSTSTPASPNGRGPQACPPDAKLIGAIALSTRDEPGTWWHLTRTGFDASGITDYLGELERGLGMSFPDLASAVAYLVAQVEPLDENRNGFVCAYRGRGVVAWTQDPNYWNYFFRVKDDAQATR